MTVHNQLTSMPAVMNRIEARARRVGVLALQGGFDAHARALASIGLDVVLVRSPPDLDGVDGLVLPGGESTTQIRLLDRWGLWAPLDRFVRSGKPVLATCAGLILAARHVEASNEQTQRSFGWLDVSVTRNGWGRQLDSFEAKADETSRFEPEGPIEMVFIRAPRLRAMGAGVEILATYEKEPVLVRQGSIVGATFHPELTNDRRVFEAVFGSQWR